MRQIIYCPNCGAEQIYGAKFCSNCGSPTTMQEITDSRRPRQINMNYTPSTENISQQDGKMGIKYQSGGSSGGDHNMLVAICVLVMVAAVVIAVCCILLLGRSSGNTAKNTVENTDIVTVPSTESTVATSENLQMTTEEVSLLESSTAADISSGGEIAGYTDEEFLDAAVDYCKYVYGVQNPSAKLDKSKNGKIYITISVTIDGNAGEMGIISIDRKTGIGTGCKGERTDLFSPESSDVNIYYIIPYSDSRVLIDKDLEGLSRTELTLARNEIYARHGRKFKDDDIREYFENQSWYAGIVPAYQFDDSVLSSIEKSNVAEIKSYEEYLDDSKKVDDSKINCSESEDYIIPGSSSRYLSESDLRDMDSRTLMFARNEIYARHGRKFNDDEIRSYFESKLWYTPTVDPSDFSEDMLSDVEKANIKLIKSYED